METPYLNIKPIVFDYLDYRVFLKDYWQLEKKRRPHFTLRLISSRIGINPGYIAKVFNGQVHLGIKNVDAIAKLFNLEDKEREYFIELVHFGRAKDENEIALRFERLQEIKGVEFRTIADDTVDFYRNWYPMTIRSLLSIHKTTEKDIRRISSMLRPQVSTDKVRESIKLMENLSMVVKDEDGVYQVTEQFISTGEKWNSKVIRDYQKSMIELGNRAIDEIDAEIRDISTVTMSVSLDILPEIRERIKQFRHDLLLMSQESNDDNAVMQLNIQLFPSALTEGDKA